MGIKVNIDPLISSYTNNQRTAEAEGSSVTECLKDLTEKFPGLKPFIKNGKLLVHQDSFLSVFVNGEIVYLRELDKPVKEDDELSIILMVGGG